MLTFIPFFSNQIHRSISPNWKKVWHWLLQWSWISHNKRPWWGKKLIIKRGSFWTFPRIQILASKIWAFWVLTCNLESIKDTAYYSRKMMKECTCPWYDQTVMILLKRTMKKSLMQIIHWWKLSKSTTWNPYNGQKIARPIFSQKNLA